MRCKDCEFFGKTYVTPGGVVFDMWNRCRNSYYPRHFHDNIGHGLDANGSTIALTKGRELECPKFVEVFREVV